MDKKVVVIISGGMDSTTLLYDIVRQYGKENVFALSFNYEQKHKVELRYAVATCVKLGVKHRVLDLSILNVIAPSALTRDDWKVPEGHYAQDNMKQTVVPFRNQLFLTLACAFAEGIKAVKVFYGAHGGDHFIYWDCRPDFISKFKDLISLNDMHKVKLEVPYSNINKIGILKKGLELSVDYSLTYTCYNPQTAGNGLDVPFAEIACGKCGSCSERIEAFKENKVIDPISYNINIDWSGCKEVK